MALKHSSKIRPWVKYRVIFGFDGKKGRNIHEYGLNFSGFTWRKMESLPVNRSLVKCPKKVKVFFRLQYFILFGDSK